jgi:hypothetical protein
MFKSCIRPFGPFADRNGLIAAIRRLGGIIELNNWKH